MFLELHPTLDDKCSKKMQDVRLPIFSKRSNETLTEFGALSNAIVICLESSVDSLTEHGAVSSVLAREVPRMPRGASWLVQQVSVILLSVLF